MILAAVALAASPATADVSCLAPLTEEEERQDEAARKARRRAGRLPVLQPDDDQLPAGVPDGFAPQLVTLSYRIGAAGAVSECSVIKPGGVAAPNDASCALLKAHYRTAANDKPEKAQRMAVLWTPRAVRPERRMCNDNGGTVPVSSDQWIDADVFLGVQSHAGSAHIALDVAADGRISRCSIIAADVLPALQRNLCEMAIRRAVILPAVDARQAATAAQFKAVVRFRLP